MIEKGGTECKRLKVNTIIESGLSTCHSIFLLLRLQILNFQSAKQSNISGGRKCLKIMPTLSWLIKMDM